ncbi:MAG: hypothetical protein R3F56_08425 [Planctomycetota bacterium]
MLRRLAPFSLLLAASCLVHFGWGTPRAWTTGERAFEVDPADLSQVTCATHNGDVHVSGAESADRIRVHVRTRAGGEDAADAAAAHEAIEILHKRVDGGLWLGWRWREPHRRSWQASVSFDVEQPRSMPSRVESHNGDLRVRGIDAAVTAESHNGDLALLECGGELRGTTHNGDIEAATSGPVLQLTTHNGAMRIRIVGVGPTEGEVRSHNGSITLAVDEGRSARLVCTTRNGRLRSQRQIDRQERGRNFLVADLGDGAGRLAVETYNGSIRVE